MYSISGFSENRPRRVGSRGKNREASEINGRNDVQSFKETDLTREGLPKPAYIANLS